MKLYAVSDGPPSLAVRMAIKALNIPCEEVNVDYIASEHMTESYAKVNNETPKLKPKVPTISRISFCCHLGYSR